MYIGGWPRWEGGEGNHLLGGADDDGRRGTASLQRGRCLPAGGVAAPVGSSLVADGVRPPVHAARAGDDGWGRGQAAVLATRGGGILRRIWRLILRHVDFLYYIK
jgi:hypothetical protein